MRVSSVAFFAFKPRYMRVFNLASLAFTPIVDAGHQLGLVGDRRYAEPRQEYRRTVLKFMGGVDVHQQLLDEVEMAATV